MACRAAPSTSHCTASGIVGMVTGPRRSKPANATPNPIARLDDARQRIEVVQHESCSGYGEDWQVAFMLI